jgi:CelD/BcsL family acetyltransferase involved in cellulose biosynthesis
VSLLEEGRVAAGPGLDGQWDALADRCGGDPFVRPGWIEAWCAAFGGGAPEILTARGNGRLTGVLPLLRGMGIWRSPTNEHTPAFAPLAEDRAALGALAETLLAREPAVVSIAFLDRAGPALAVLQGAMRSAGYAVNLRPIHASPVVTVDDVDTWEAARPRRALADLRRRRRRLADLGRVTVTDSRDAAALDDVFELERRGWKAAHGTAILQTAALPGFYRQVASWAEARAELRVAALRLDDRPIAALLALEDAGVLHLLKAGYDPGFARYSPGQLLLEDILRTAFATGVRVVEFHGADEPYKRVWTTAVRRRVALEAFAPTAAGHVARVAARRGRPLVRWARDHAPSHGRRLTTP